MEQNYWYKQTNEPLFPELLWSRPENKRQAGKLLIIGGNAHGFAAPAAAFAAAIQAGTGSSRVLLPHSLQKTVGKLFPEAAFALDTPVSGGFARGALGEFMEASAWADGVLIAGDIGRNSETNILLESFLEAYSGQVTLTKDAADFVVQSPIAVLTRPATLLVVSMGQLRRLGSSVRFPRAFTSELGLIPLIERLHEFTTRYPFTLIVRHQGNMVVASGGQVSTTSRDLAAIWRVGIAATAATWWLWYPSKTLESLTTAIFTL